MSVYVCCLSFYCCLLFAFLCLAIVAYVWFAFRFLPIDLCAIVGIPYVC